MTTPRESVVFVLPDKMGGATNIVANVLACREPDALSYHAILTHNALSTDTRFAERLVADTQRTFEYRTPVENLHAVVRRLRRALPDGGGILVTNDLLELAMASAMDVGRTVMMVLHGDHDYYYDLAVRHEDAIDVFICYGRTMLDTLRARLPHRTASMVHLPYGIPMPSKIRTARPGPLRLLFAGRLEHGQKGVLDLPKIDAVLQKAGVSVTWTIVGGGPDEAALRDQWRDAPHVAWLGSRSNADVIAIAADHDVFVLPTRAEGFPVALVEAMATGLAAVVSDLPSGVRELVLDGVHGFTPPVGDIEAFAGAIRTLAGDRARLEAMGHAAWQTAVERHDIRDRVRAWQSLFERHHEFRRPRALEARLLYGSRLDRAWIPNVAVKTVRSLLRRAQRKAV